MTVNAETSVRIDAPVDRDRIRSAWEGRISGCQLGKPVEVLSMLKGRGELTAYLEEAAALPLRDYVPLIEDTLVAQIRADLFGWVCPGRPAQAAELARQDAQLSHRGDGVHGAAFVAALGAAIPSCRDLGEAIDVAAAEVPKDSEAGAAIVFGRDMAERADAVDRLHERYAGLSPVHTVNNLALVVWGLLSGADNFSQAVGDVVAAGWDTDCNAATVGGLWGLSGREIPGHWTEPWQGRVAVTLAGMGELQLDDLVDRTVKVAEKLSA
jgi:ADP-ribosylglycohydrolase